MCPLTTHVHNEEVEPAPGIGEVVFEAIGHPLEQHLKHKDKGKHSVGIFQQGLHRGLLVKVIVFKDLEGREQNGRLPGITAPGSSGGEGPSQACPHALGQFWGPACWCCFEFSAPGQWGSGGDTVRHTPGLPEPAGTCGPAHTLQGS